MLDLLLEDLPRCSTYGGLPPSASRSARLAKMEQGKHNL